MDAIIAAHETLERKSNLSKTITDVQSLIDQLQRTRDAVAETPELTPMHIAKLKQPIKSSFEKLDDDLKEVNKGLNQYQKALRERFKNATLPTTINEGLDTGLVDRAIAMHLLREGKFGVARTFVREVNDGLAAWRASLHEMGVDEPTELEVRDRTREILSKASEEKQALLRNQLRQRNPAHFDLLVANGGDPLEKFMESHARETFRHEKHYMMLANVRNPGLSGAVNTGLQNLEPVAPRELMGRRLWEREFADSDAMMLEMDGEERMDEREDGEVLEGKGSLQRRFTEMYKILNALRTQHDLGPAIAWAKENSTELETRGSDLEFELSRLKFVELYTSSHESMSEDDFTGPMQALGYAQTVFPAFSTRYGRDISHLLGSTAYSSAISDSPYKTFFFNQYNWEEVSTSFTREFCSMLGLSSTSPLYTAVTAGGIALPVLEKVERVMAASRGQWTSENELPVEIPLPPEMLFHSIFVCPVSKEQGTDQNPPTLLQCGHVIAEQSMYAHARGKQTMKCPYCPIECRLDKARRLFI